MRNARFAPDGQTIVYSAAWEGDPLEIFSKTAEGPESRALGFNGADLVAIASTGEMAISVNYRLVGTYIGTGTLSRAPLAAGAPRAVLDDVQSADWSPDGSNLAVVRNVNGRTRLEFPIGKSLYQTGGWVSHPRVSPDGTTVAFVDHPLQGDDGGSISVVDATGKKRDLTKGWYSVQGLAWANRTKSGSPARRRALRAHCSPSRPPAPNGSWPGFLARSPCTTSPRTDRVLLARDTWRRELMGMRADEAKERNLSWQDYSYPRSSPTTAQTLLFDEEGEAGGYNYAVFIRKTDGSAAVEAGARPRRLAVARWQVGHLADDDRAAASWCCCRPAPAMRAADARFAGARLGALDARRTPSVFAGSEEGKGNRFYLMSIDGGAPEADLWRGHRRPAIRHRAGRTHARGDRAGRPRVSVPDRGRRPAAVFSASRMAECTINWTSDGKGLFVTQGPAIGPRASRGSTSTTGQRAMPGRS